MWGPPFLGYKFTASIDLFRGVGGVFVVQFKSWFWLAGLESMLRELRGGVPLFYTFFTPMIVAEKYSVYFSEQIWLKWFSVWLNEFIHYPRTTKWWKIHWSIVKDKVRNTEIHPADVILGIVEGSFFCIPIGAKKCWKCLLTYLTQAALDL